ALCRSQVCRGRTNHDAVASLCDPPSLRGGVEMRKQSRLCCNRHMPGLSRREIDLAEPDEPCHATGQRRVKLNALFSGHLAVIRDIDIRSDGIAGAGAEICDREAGVREAEPERKERRELLLLEPAIAEIRAFEVIHVEHSSVPVGAGQFRMRKLTLA